jgi:hypothetical protein
MNYTSGTMPIIDSLRLKRRGWGKNLNFSTCSGWKTHARGTARKFPLDSPAHHYSPGCGRSVQHYL